MVNKKAPEGDSGAFFNKTQSKKLLLCFFPVSFSNKGGQVAAVSGFCFESIAFAAFITIGNEFGNFSGDFLLVLTL